MNFQATLPGPPLMLFRIGIYCRFAVNSDSAFAEFHSHATHFYYYSILMTALEYSVAAGVYKTGMPFYHKGIN